MYGYTGIFFTAERICGQTLSGSWVCVDLELAYGYLVLSIIAGLVAWMAIQER